MQMTRVIHVEDVQSSHRRLNLLLIGLGTDVLELNTFPKSVSV